MERERANAKKKFTVILLNILSKRMRDTQTIWKREWESIIKASNEKIFGYDM